VLKDRGVPELHWCLDATLLIIFGLFSRFSDAPTLHLHLHPHPPHCTDVWKGHAPALELTIAADIRTELTTFIKVHTLLAAGNFGESLSGACPAKSRPAGRRNLRCSPLSTE
jgi:hypothetical protein